MNDFTFQAPTKVVFGKGVENQVGQLCKEQGATKVLVHFGGQSAKKSGLLDRVFASLDKAGIPYVSLGGVKPNPRLSLVYEGIELCRKEGVDFLLPVGGGSVIDSAKAIGYGLANDFDVWDLYDRKHTAAGCAPIGAVLTIAAAGSEMSDSSVITKEEGGIKRGYNSDLCRCRFAVMNPELTYTLPAYQTACGAADIMMHVMERYFVQEDTLALTDGMAEALIRTEMTNAPISKPVTDRYKARAEIMWDSSLAQLEHELGGMFDVAHGAGLAAVWGSWARYVYEEKPERFAQFAHAIFQIPLDGGPKTAALRGIEAMEEFYRSIGMPVNIHQLGCDLTEEQIDTLAEKCCFGGRTIGLFKILRQEDIRAIYHMAKGC